MGRLFTLLAVAGVMGLMVGCNHFAGICDCDRCHDPCCYGPTSPPGSVEYSPTAPAEISKDKPAKPLEKAKER
jgi:hypothetical protein